MAVEKPTVDSITPPTDAPSENADPKTKEELKNSQEMGVLDRKSYGQDIDERKSYADKIFKLVRFWLFILFAIIVANGIPCLHFNVSDRVLIALITGTTVDVIGLFAIVCNYLFPKRPG